jgi:alkyl hydroperoxide reductase subunit AhpF
LNIIKGAPSRLKKPVRLVLFQAERGCPACPDALELCRAIKAHMNMIALETYDIVMDRDKSEQYGVKRAPALVVQGGDGRAVTFSGLPSELALETMMSTIRAVSESKVWFPGDVLRALQLLSHDVKIQVFVRSDCLRCRLVAESAIGMALESPNIYTDIVIASDFPELMTKYRITTLPKTIFGENLERDGHVTESEFLEMVFQAEGVKPGPDRRCLICGKASADVICVNCKAKIQAEAIDHKTRIEKGMQP